MTIIGLGVIDTITLLKMAVGEGWTQGAPFAEAGWDHDALTCDLAVDHSTGMAGEEALSENEGEEGEKGQGRKHDDGSRQSRSGVGSESTGEYGGVRHVTADMDRWRGQERANKSRNRKAI